MSRYIKKHREQFTWVIIPLFCLVLLGGLSFSVFPGWIRPAFSTLGAPCLDAASNAIEPLLAACNPCRDEFCNATTLGTTGTCDQGFFNQSFPQCQCESTLMSINFAQTQFFFFTGTFGGPDNGFCADISGGQVDNNCRNATCTTNTTFDPGNPTGCDFEFNPNLALCSNCIPTGADPCGNGICDQDLGEDFNDCGEDCTAPGFQFNTVFAENDPILDAACNTGGGGGGISFAGNIQGSGFCEDGDVCTTNTCQGNPPAAVKLGALIGFCDIEPAGCSGNASDLCCPDACNPAPDGEGTCNTALDPNCDVDCLPDCGVPVPPTNILDASGTSLLCSLADRGSSNGIKGGLSLLSLALGLGFLAALRRRELR